jgi:hypothetical protein
LRREFGGTVRGGKVELDDKIGWGALLARLDGKRIRVSLETLDTRRSSQQNRWYFAMVVPFFSEWTGYDKDEAHNVLKSLFLKVEKVLPTGEVIQVPGSTARLTKAEFSEYCERVMRFLAENGVYVPAPGERLEAEL